MQKMLDQIQINKAIELLLQNEIIILPTDTIYGFSAVISDSNMVRINALKQRDALKPLVILVGSLDQAASLIEINDQIKNFLLSETPTTVIANLKNSKSTIAIRIVKRDDIRQIIAKVGPIFSTSVNITGQKHATTKDELSIFLTQISNIFWTEPLNLPPSDLFDAINGIKKR